MRLRYLGLVVVMLMGCDEFGALGAIGHGGATCDRSACGDDWVRLGGSLPVAADRDLGTIVIRLCGDDVCRTTTAACSINCSEFADDVLSRGCENAPEQDLCTDDSLWHLTIQRRRLDEPSVPWTDITVTVRDMATDEVWVHQEFHVEPSDYNVVRNTRRCSEVECLQVDLAWDLP